jgi:XTP/dITP diphosphohydrolase
MEIELVLASNNPHKHREFARLFPGFGILTPRDAGVELSFPEKGGSFLENAHGKAMALHTLVHAPVIADDSGLCVRALGGAPGIRSSRYGAQRDDALLEAPRRNAYLLDQMEGMSDREAYFVCCLVLLLDGERFLIAQETARGLVAHAPRGDNGFGYDPLFLLPELGRTMAELEDREKDRVSHRGKAARRIRAALESGS